MPWVDTLLAVVSGAIAGGASTTLVQMLSHRREQSTQKRRQLRDAYADWLAALEEDGMIKRNAAMRSDTDPSPFTSEEISTNRRQVRLLTYRLLLLETEESWRTRILELAVELDPYLTWETTMEFVAEVKGWAGQDDSSPPPPYGERLHRTAAELSERLSS